VSERTGKSVSFIAGVVVAAVVLGGGGVALAATGSTLILGHTNKAGKITKIVDKKGTPLGLTAKAGKAPLTVNTGTKVTHLNADAIDGLSSGSFARASGQFGVITAESVFIDLDEDGTNDALLAVAECPTGTKLTGGGIDNFSSGFTYVDSPDTGAWIALSGADPSVDATADLVDYAICYNPKGAVAGAQTFTAKTKIPAALKERVVRAMKHRS
jgi:hypothetical protein